MAYRLAQSLVTFRAEVNARWPGRDKSSDGWIGDAAHASRKSDHNPWVKDSRGVGVVRAYDVDAGPGADRDIGLWIAEHVRSLGAVGFSPLGVNSYVISAGRIASATGRWAWRSYGGSNPHHSHTHVSVTTDPGGYDSNFPWGISTAPVVPAGNPRPPQQGGALLKKGSRGPEVVKLQQVLNRWYPSLTPLKADGVFGSATQTRVKYFQKRAGLVSDGIVGPKSRAVLHL